MSVDGICALAPAGAVMWTSGDEGEETLSSMSWADVLERGRRPQPAFGEPWRLLELDVVDGKLAVAQVEIARSGGSYVDYLLLYRLADGWRIVSARTPTPSSSPATSRGSSGQGLTSPSSPPLTTPTSR